jgi:hypothetical protein
MGEPIERCPRCGETHPDGACADVRRTPPRFAVLRGRPDGEVAERPRVRLVREYKAQRAAGLGEAPAPPEPAAAPAARAEGRAVLRGPGFGRRRTRWLLALVLIVAALALAAATYCAS